MMRRCLCGIKSNGVDENLGLVVALKESKSVTQCEVMHVFMIITSIHNMDTNDTHTYTVAICTDTFKYSADALILTKLSCFP